MKKTSSALRLVSLAAVLTAIFAILPFRNGMVKAQAHYWVFDPGHGGTSPGATYQGRLEKTDNLNIAIAVARRLQRSGEKVLFTRADDSAVSLSERAQYANAVGAEYFVSFHRNSASTVGNGVEVYYHSSLSPASPAAKIATAVQNSLVSLGFYNRGVKQANFAVLRETAMPAILIELGFINNEAENAKLDAEFDLIADAIASALLAYIGKALVPEKPETVESTEPPTKATETMTETTDCEVSAGSDAAETTSFETKQNTTLPAVTTEKQASSGTEEDTQTTVPVTPENVTESNHTLPDETSVGIETSAADFSSSTHIIITEDTAADGPSYSNESKRSESEIAERGAFVEPEVSDSAKSTQRIGIIMTSIAVIAAVSLCIAIWLGNRKNKKNSEVKK